MTNTKLILSLAVLAFNIPALGDPLVYIVSAGITGNGQFGTIDLTTGAYQQTGPIEPDGYFGLAPGPNGSLIAGTYAGNLDSINPATGVATRIGPTGLGSCVVPSPSCGPNSYNTLGALAGTIYGTDYENNLYVMNPLTGTATLLNGHSGLPAIPFIPGSMNPDGTINFYDEAIWGAGGKLYATFDAFIFDLSSFTVVSTVITPELYQINPSTGGATAIGATDLGIGAGVDVDGTSYAFNDLTNQIESIDLSTGRTNVLGQFDPAAGVIQGATAAVPEPGSIGLVVIGIALGMIGLRRRRVRQLARPPSGR